MLRGLTGRYSTARVGGETIRAFVPDPLPPEPPVDLGGHRQRLLERALLACGRLDGVTVPDPDLFLYGYVRREAVLSSQIEGTQSSLADLMQYEADASTPVPFDDVTEVSRYVAALDHGLQRLRAGFPLSSRLIREMHGVLMHSGRGADKSPGEFRSSQNWIGGSRPGNAVFVPPPPHEVAGCMSQLERFIHAEHDGLPVLVRTALAHAQFETIHPFLDGNGRIGRLLIVLMLVHAGVLSQPLLYVSLYLKRQRAEYYRLLDTVRTNGDWESWVEFFLDGVIIAAESAVESAHRLNALFQDDTTRITALGSRSATPMRIFALLKARPVLTITDAAERIGISYPAAARTMEQLVRLGIVHETTGRKRQRLYAYGRYVELLSEGTEPL